MAMILTRIAQPWMEQKGRMLCICCIFLNFETHPNFSFLEEDFYSVAKNFIKIVGMVTI